MDTFCQNLCADPIAALSGWFVLVPSLVLLLSAAAAVAARNLVRAALLATLSFVALGVVFIALGAEFVGFAQLLVYVGAVAMLIVFVILLTKPEQLARSPLAGAGPAGGILVAFALLAALLGFIFASPAADKALPAASAAAPVAAIGRALLGEYVVVFIALGVLLTAALIGAAVIALEDEEP